tara:strand:+ start:35067 stop:35687 length:621 start_codon:yes stop_codon:yes gene_type:complete
VKVLVIGANGKVGRLAVEKIKSEKGMEPTAMIRKKSQADFFKGMEVDFIEKDLSASKEILQDIIRNFDAVVFTAGSGGNTGAEKTLEIDLDAAVKCMEAAEESDVKKFVLVSAAYADEREFWDRTALKPYYIAKHYADLALKNSSLNYSILRPVSLTDEDAKGQYHFKSETDDSLGDSVSREDVANLITDCLTKPEFNRRVIEFSN